MILDYLRFSPSSQEAGESSGIPKQHRLVHLESKSGFNGCAQLLQAPPGLSPRQWGAEHCPAHHRSRGGETAHLPPSTPKIWWGPWHPTPQLSCAWALGHSRGTAQVPLSHTAATGTSSQHSWDQESKGEPDIPGSA